MVSGVLSWCIRCQVDVRYILYILYIILLYTYIYILLYYIYIILYYILYYTLLSLLLFLSYSSSSLLVLYSPPSSISLTLPIFQSIYNSHHSFYTCRCLFLDTYILEVFVCIGLCSVQISKTDPACFIGVDG